MAVDYVSEEDLESYLLLPDCPECGSEDVVCTATVRDGDYIVKQYFCNKCGHVWAEREHV